MILELNMKPGLPPEGHKGEVLIKHRYYGWMIGCWHSSCWGGMGFNRVVGMAQGIIFIDSEADNAIGWVAIHPEN